MLDGRQDDEVRAQDGVFSEGHPIIAFTYVVTFINKIQYGWKTDVD